MSLEIERNHDARSIAVSNFSDQPQTFELTEPPFKTLVPPQRGVLVWFNAPLKFGANDEPPVWVKKLTTFLLKGGETDFDGLAARKGAVVEPGKGRFRRQ
jgi:hypothetical protein